MPVKTAPPATWRHDEVQRKYTDSPVWHAANEDIRIGGELAEVELLAARRAHLDHSVHGQLRVLVVALDL